MKKINFALISDTLFFGLCAFLVSFTVVRFYSKNALLALLLAIAAALAFGALCFILLYGKRQKKLTYLLSEEEKKSLSLHLSVCSKTYIENLLKSALDGAYVGDNGIEDEKNAYFFNFKMAPLSADDVAEVIKTERDKPKKLFCCYISPDALELADGFDVGVATIGEVYLLLKERGLLPEKYALGRVKKRSVFYKVKMRFTRRLTPALFFGGVTLLAFSFFTFFPVYYIVCGCALTALSVVCLFIGQSS